MSGADLKSTRLVQGVRAEQIRIRPDTKDGRPVVRLDLLEPVASHAAGSLTVKGAAFNVPLASVDELLQSIYLAKVEAGGEPPPNERGDW